MIKQTTIKYSSEPDDDLPDNNDSGQTDTAEAVAEDSQVELDHPKKYKVLLCNDDYTPMEFVVGLLEKFFGMNREVATRIMLKVHMEGKAVCGVYSRDVAETKVSQVNQYARDHGHPLLCEIEPADDDDF